MSFLSSIGGFFSKVGHGIATVETGVQKVTDVIAPFAPFISGIPAIGGPFGLIFNLVVQAEQLVSANSKGADKKAAVLAFVKLAYPNLNQEAMSADIDALVAILNRMAAEVEAAPPAPGV